MIVPPPPSFLTLPAIADSLTSVILASECVETQVQGQLILLVPQLLGNLGLHLAVLLPQLVVILRVEHFPGNWSINEILQVVEVSSVGYSDHKNGEVPALSLAQLKTLLKKLSKLLVNVRIRNISGKNIIVDNGDTPGIVKSLKRFKQQTDDTNNSKTYRCLVNKINNK